MPLLFLLRHAEAVQHGDARFASDADRPLTPNGLATMERGALGMKRLGWSFDAILASPLVRARQTAECVASVLGIENRLLVEEAMESGTDWGRLRLALHAHRGRERVLCVGHQPDLSEIAAAVLGGGPASIAFGKGSLAGIKIDAMPPEAAGTLRFLFRLDQLAAMGS